jgi:hypothetical protein
MDAEYNYDLTGHVRAVWTAAWLRTARVISPRVFLFAHRSTYLFVDGLSIILRHTSKDLRSTVASHFRLRKPRYCFRCISLSLLLRLPPFLPSFDSSLLPSSVLICSTSSCPAHPACRPASRILSAIPRNLLTYLCSATRCDIFSHLPDASCCAVPL